MILITIEQVKDKLILHAVDTYSGSSTAIATSTTDELILRFHPLLRAWLDFSKGRDERYRSSVDPPEEISG